MTETPAPDDIRYDAQALEAFACALLTRNGLPEDRARDVAAILVYADLTGHDTHGLNLLPVYLEHLTEGFMAANGNPVVVNDYPAALTWDGCRLPGPWLVLRAMEIAIERARIQGTCTVTIRNGHHIGSLSAYLKRATDQGMIMQLYSSAPTGGSVAPFGGRRALFSPSPMAMGCPTDGDPILVDISTSSTTNNLLVRLRRQGKRLPHAFLLDEDGLPTNDPMALAPPRQGTILPAGGSEGGHKGYGLALMVESLTAGLTDHGRHQPSTPFANTIFIQMLNPDAFGGTAALKQQMSRIAEACVNTPPRPGVDRVRVPGERALALARAYTRDGVRLAEGIVPALQPWAARLGVAMPAALEAAS